MKDVVSASDVRPAGQSVPGPALKGVTSIVRPGEGLPDSGCGCTGVTQKAPSSEKQKPVQAEALGKAKEEIIAEVVRRVTEQLC